MPTSTLVRAPVVEIGGQLLSDAEKRALVRLDVRLALHDPSVVEIEFVDRDFAILDGADFHVGADVEVWLPDVGGAHEKVFKGKLTSIAVEQSMELGGDSIPRLVLEAQDASHAFGSSATFTAFLQGARDVVAAIANRHGLTPKVDRPAVLDKYVAQARSDRETLDELTRLCDFEWFVRGGELHFRKPLAPVAGTRLSRTDSTLRRFSVRYSGVDVPASVSSYGSGLEGGRGHEGRAGVVTEAAVGSDPPLVGTEFAEAKSAFGKPLAVGDVPSHDTDEAKAAADAIARRLLRRGLRAEGVAASAPALKPGDYVTIAEMGQKLSGNYYLTEVRHEFTVERETITTFVCGGAREASTEPSVGWAGGGPVVGVVANINDPDGLGRVKVKFPSLADTESDWARVVSIGAGADRGIDFRPEVNDEVLVVFEHGDPRFPLILGGLWNKSHKHPVAGIGDGNKVEQRVIRSRTGHKIILGDGSGDADKHVTVELTNGTKLVLSQDTGALLDVAKGEVVIKTKQGSIKLTEQGDLTVDANKVDVKAKSPVSVDGKATVAVKGAGGLKLEGTSQFEVKGGLGKVEAQGILQVKGAMVKIN